MDESKATSTQHSSKARARNPAGGLNREQAEAVTFDHGSRGAALVLAGAGSGKTTVLTRRIAHLMASGVRGDAILALTFTQDAAREMRARLRSWAEGNQGSIPGVERGGLPQIGTFHAFAYALIGSGRNSRFRTDGGSGAKDGPPNWQRLGFASRPVLCGAGDRRAWLSGQELPPGFSLGAVEAWLARPFDPDEEDASREERDGSRGDLRARFRAHLLSAGTLEFDDMVPLALRLLREHSGVRSDVRARISHVLVDEFQDTGPDQLELVRLLMGERRSLFLVGDDDQAIYAFRGADSGNIGRALEAFPGLEILKLETNYRSTPPIVAYANCIFRDKPARLRKRLRAGRPSAGRRRADPVRTTIHSRGPDQARWMAAEMRRLRREEGLAWSDIAILYRINALEEYYRSLLRTLVGEDAAREVVLSTVHAAKGLQYPAVFFVGLEDGILPYRRSGEKPDPERIAEEKRIFYVGVTRAERFLYLCALRRRMLRGKFRDYPVSPFLGRRPGVAWLARLGGIWGRGSAREAG